MIKLLFKLLVLASLTISCSKAPLSEEELDSLLKKQGTTSFSNIETNIADYHSMHLECNKFEKQEVAALLLDDMLVSLQGGRGMLADFVKNNPPMVNLDSYPKYLKVNLQLSKIAPEVFDEISNKVANFPAAKDAARKYSEKTKYYIAKGAEYFSKNENEFKLFQDHLSQVKALQVCLISTINLGMVNADPTLEKLGREVSIEFYALIGKRANAEVEKLKSELDIN